MGTDYDPPTRYDDKDDLQSMSKDMLKLLEKEMGINLLPNSRT